MHGGTAAEAGFDPRAMLEAGDWAGIEALARDAASLKKP